MNEFTIRKPDNPHGHLRRGLILSHVLPFAYQNFARYVVMGNIFGRPIETGLDALDYKKEIKDQAPADFEPWMVIMLTENTTRQTILDAYGSGVRYVKVILKGASTNSDNSITLQGLREKYPILRGMEKICLDPNMKDMILSIHPELTHDPITGAEIPLIDQEEAALPFCKELVDTFPGLKIIFEHLSTKAMIDFVESTRPNVAATLMPMHATTTCNMVCDRFGKVINPLLFFKPVAKQLEDVRAVRRAMISGNPKFFFATDSAPHWLCMKDIYLLNGKKPAAGVLSDPVAIPIVTQIFFDEIAERRVAKRRLENFTSRYWAEFMNLPLNEGTVNIIYKPWLVPREHKGIPVFMGGQKLDWQVRAE